MFGYEPERIIHSRDSLYYFHVRIAYMNYLALLACTNSDRYLELAATVQYAMREMERIAYNLGRT